MNSFVYMVSYFDNHSHGVDHLFFRSKSLKFLFDELIDLFGDDGEVIEIERVGITDLDLMYSKEVYEKDDFDEL